MCRVTSRELGRAPSAAAEARRFVTESLHRWGLEPLVLDAELLVSELVTNAVLHARSEVAVSVAVAAGTVEVGVTDRSVDLPQQRRVSWRAEGGRGLRLVDAVARDWGVAHLPDGKQVWFRLDVGDDWPHRSGCPCDGAELDRVRLLSGRWAMAVPGPWDDVAGR